MGEPALRALRFDGWQDFGASTMSGGRSMKSRLSPTVRQGYPALAACKALANRLAAAVQHFHGVYGL